MPGIQPVDLQIIDDPALESRLISWIKSDRSNKDKEPQKMVEKKKKSEMTAAEAQQRKEERRDAMVDVLPTSIEYQTIAAYILTEFNGTPVTTHIR